MPDEYTKLIEDHKASLDSCHNFYLEERDKVIFPSFWKRILSPTSLEIAKAKLDQLYEHEKIAIKNIEQIFIIRKNNLITSEYKLKPESDQEFMTYLETKAQVSKLTAPELVWIQTKTNEADLLQKKQKSMLQAKTASLDAIASASQANSGAFESIKSMSGLLGAAGAASGLSGMANMYPGQIIPTNDPQSMIGGSYSHYTNMKYYERPKEPTKTEPELEVMKQPKGRKFK